MVEKEASAYMERLDKHETEERARLEAEGKLRPRTPCDLPDKESAPVVKTKSKTISTTDPDAGLLGRPGKPLGTHYLTHQSVDSKCGVIVDVEVTAGNTNDCIPYLDRVEYMSGNIGINIEAVALDSAYDTSLIHKELMDMNIDVFTPKTKTNEKYKVEFKRDSFQYNEEEDTFICPNGQLLTFHTLERSESTISREYTTKPENCRACPLKEKCLSPSHKSRRLGVNIFEDAVRKHHEHDGTIEHKKALNTRQIICEGTFGNQVRKHNLRKLSRRGLEAAFDHCLLSATVVNIKRMVKKAG